MTNRFRDLASLGPEKVDCEWTLKGENSGRLISYPINNFTVGLLWRYFFVCWEQKAPVEEADEEHLPLIRNNIGLYAKKLLRIFSEEMSTIKEWTPKNFVK